VTTMRWLSRHICAAGLVTATAMLSASGCADNESSLFVRAVMVVEPPDCTVSADPSSTVLGSGTMDVALTDTYRAALLVGNQLVNRGSRDQLRTETSRISLRGAEVHVESAGGTELDAFTVDGSGFVDPGTSADPGYGLMFVPLIPPSTASSLINAADTYVGRVVTVRVKVFGRTLGGTEIESNELYFTISICSGCLVSYPLSADNQTTPGVYDCWVDPSQTSSGASTLPCWPGQDFAIECTDCMALYPNNPVCSGP
jgi:hypothetical protein